MFGFVKKMHFSTENVWVMIYFKIKTFFNPEPYEMFFYLYLKYNNRNP